MSELAQRIGVSGETIRRDLAELVDAGLVSRTYGGATLAPFVAEPSVGERDRTLVAERFRIAAAAAQEVENGQLVTLDGGSTTRAVARHLAQLRRDLTIITNSLGVAIAAGANPTFRVLLCPGRYHAGEGSVFGEDTTDYLARFHAHVAIIGATGLTNEGPSEAVSGAAAVKRVMLRRAAATLLVLDHSKFERTSVETVCDFSALGTIVTDAPLPPLLARAAAEGGTRVVVA
ncbi:MAG: DeoR/GlpR family DNA-binding transcription regulator [Burkholderiales bacterium]|nr:DeoR/GlpR family DNA-binding transcription regulator [Burkholderiales bacterium]